MVLAMSDRRLRVKLAAVCRDMGPRAFPKLLELLKNPALRDGAGELLDQTAGPSANGQVPAFIDCLKDKEIKHYCGRALLLAINPRSAAPVSKLIESLKKNSDADARIYAAGALGMLGPGAAAAVPVLIEIAGGPNAARAMAVKALGNIGRGARAAIPVLKQALQDNDGEVRRSAAHALKQINK